MTDIRPICILALFLALPLGAETIELRPGVGVDGTSLEPYSAHYREISLADGSPSGAERQTRLERIRVRGRDAWRLGITMLGREATVYDEIQMMADTLEPVMRYVSGLTLLHQIEVFDGASMSGYRIAGDASSAQPVDIQPEGVRFGGPIDALVLAGRRLEVGMRLDLPGFSTDMGPAGANLISRLHVLKSEQIEAAGRSWSTWVIETELLDSSGKPLTMPDGTPMPKSKKWIASEPPYGIRSQWRPDSVVELVDVR